MVKLLFTRHAETKNNREGKIQQHEHSDITEDGFLQIQGLIENLKDKKITKIISSDSPRCKITAEIINKSLNVPIEENQLLRDKNNGEWEGKSASEINWDSLSGTFETRKAPGGESLINVRERGKKFMEYVLSNYEANEVILVVSHSAFLKVLIGHLIGTDIKSSVFKLLIDCCSLTSVVYQNNEPENYRVSYVNHIPGD